MLLTTEPSLQPPVVVVIIVVVVVVVFPVVQHWAVTI